MFARRLLRPLLAAGGAAALAAMAGLVPAWAAGEVIVPGEGSGGAVWQN